MSSLSARRKLGLKLDIKPTKTISQLWAEYGPALNAYYNINQYSEATIIKTVENVSKGSNKIISMEGDSNGNIYAIAKYTNVINVNELETHMKVLLQFLKERRLFDIPLLYYDAFRYISSFINFVRLDGAGSPPASASAEAKHPKMSKNSLKYCAAEGQFLTFMINELNLLPLDVESYVSRDTDKMVFLDFGEVAPPKNEAHRREFIDQYLNDVHLTLEVLACIKGNYVPLQPLLIQ